MKTRIISDSAMDLLPEIKERVSVVPLKVHFGEEEYLDGVTIDHNTFYEKLTSSSVLPSTSLASPEAFMKEFDKVKEAGDEAVVITISPNLSGTHQSAKIASSYYENIYIVDSSSVAVGGGILVELAVKLLDEGLTAKEIAEKLEEAKSKIVVLALLDTLEYLKRGGRISKTTALAGTLLNIKPLMLVLDGKIEMINKARGLKAGNALILEEAEKAGGIDFSLPCLVGYSGTTDKQMLKFKDFAAPTWETEMKYTTLGSVIGTHAGPGAVVLAFFKK